MLQVGQAWNVLFEDSVTNSLVEYSIIVNSSDLNPSWTQLAFGGTNSGDFFQIDDVSVSKMLLDKRLAVSYNGGTKTSPEDWMKYHSGEYTVY